MLYAKKSDPKMIGRIAVDPKGVRWFIPDNPRESGVMCCSENDGFDMVRGEFWYKIDEHPELADLEPVVVPA